MEGIPIVRLKAKVTTGAHEGKEPSQSFFCEGKPPTSDPKEMPTAEQQLLGLIAWLLPDIQIDDPSQIEDAIAEINNRIPLCIVGVSNKKGTKDPTKIYQNIFFNKLVKPATTEAPDHAPVDGDTEVDAPADYVPAKGDMVFAGDDGIEYEVVQVSQSKRTVNLVDASGSKLGQVAWDTLQPA
jgi:hypothetical protein